MRYAGIALLQVFLAANAIGQGTIVMKAATRVPPEAAVTVRDVASLVGPDAEALAMIVVIPARERAGGRESVGAERVRAAIDVHDGPPVNWGRVTLGGGTCVVLPAPAPPEAKAPTTTAATPESGTVRAAIAARLGHVLQVDRADLRLAFDEGDREILDLRVEGRTIDVRPTGMSERIPLAVTVYGAAGSSGAPGRIVAARTVRVGVKVRRSVVIAVAARRRGDLIGPADVTTEERWMAPGTPGPAPEQIVGAGVRTRLVPGEPIAPGDIEPPLVVERGDLVSVHCVSGLLVVRTTARAMGDARDGEVVRLQSLADESRVFYGRMSGRGRAVAVSEPTSNG